MNKEWFGWFFIGGALGAIIAGIHDAVWPLLILANLLWVRADIEKLGGKS